MNVIKYDPFRELRGLNNEINRLFAGIPAFSSREDLIKGAWNPNVNIYEDKENLILEAELPGLSKDDFEINVENNVLTLKGERKFENETSGENFHCVERSYGSFTRQFTLPSTVTAEGAKADLENGVLKVSLPKREETKARKIEITGSSAAKAIEADVKTETAQA